MSRVFEGGEGVMSGGMEERSSERGVWKPLDMEEVGLEEIDAGGDWTAIAVGLLKVVMSMLCVKSYVHNCKVARGEVS